MNFNKIFERKESNDKLMGISNNNEIDHSGLLNMAHYEELYLVLADSKGTGEATDIIGAKNTAMELCKKYPDMVKAWANEKDNITKEAMLHSMLTGTNKEQN